MQRTLGQNYRRFFGILILIAIAICVPLALIANAYSSIAKQEIKVEDQTIPAVSMDYNVFDTNKVRLTFNVERSNLTVANVKKTSEETDASGKTITKTEYVKEFFQSYTIFLVNKTKLDKAAASGGSAYYGDHIEKQITVTQDDTPMDEIDASYEDGANVIKAVTRKFDVLFEGLSRNTTYRYAITFYYSKNGSNTSYVKEFNSYFTDEKTFTIN